jgi:hypothetical protein
MAELLDPHQLLEAARRAMSIPAGPDKLRVRSLELINGRFELIFDWNDFPDPLGFRFEVPGTTDHPSWRNWAPATVDEWAQYAVHVAFLEEMQTGLLYRARRDFDGNVIWLAWQKEDKQQVCDCGPVRCPGDFERLHEARLSTAAGREALAAGRVTIWTQAMTFPARNPLGQFLMIGEPGSKTANVIEIEISGDVPRRKEVLSSLIGYGITAAAERGILRITSGEACPELLAEGFIPDKAGLSYLTSARARVASETG